MFWLAADLRIRAVSDDTRSLNDFCAAFLGPAAGSGPFTEDEVVTALEELAPHDWRGEITRRIDAVAHELDTGFMEWSGWRRSDRPAACDAKQLLALYRPHHIRTSLGMVLHRGRVAEVVPDSPAARAGVHEGDYVHAVNDRVLRDNDQAMAKAIVYSPLAGVVRLHLHRDGTWQKVDSPYREGLRMHTLQRVADTPDRLAAILSPCRDDLSRRARQRPAR